MLNPTKLAFNSFTYLKICIYMSSVSNPKQDLLGGDGTDTINVSWSCRHSLSPALLKVRLLMLIFCPKRLEMWSPVIDLR